MSEFNPCPSKNCMFSTAKGHPEIMELPPRSYENSLLANLSKIGERVFKLGGGITTTDLKEAAGLLLKREYPQVSTKKS